MNEKHYDVIIVGAGMAGLTSAAYLTKSGYRVLIVEKNHKNGGLLGAFMIDGHQVDQGARGIIDSGIFTPMMKQLGIEVEFLPNPVRLAIGDNYVDFRDKSGLDDYGKLLKETYPGNSAEIDRILEEIRKVMGYMDVLYGIENPLFMSKPYDYGYMLKTLLPWTVKFVYNIRKAMKLLEPINDHLRRITKNESLVQIITQHFFESTPTFFALSYFSLYLDYQYPKGSTQVVVDKLEEVIRKNHGVIMNGREVVHIDPEKRIVRLNEGNEYSYDQMIWAADSNMLYRCLDAASWQESPLKNEVTKKQEFLMNKKGADSVLTVYVITDQSPDTFKPISGPHVFYTPSKEGLSGITLSDLRDGQGNFTDDLDRIYDWLRVFVRQNTFEISIPSLRDPSLSPPGETALIVSLLFDHGLAKHIASIDSHENLKKMVTEMVLDELDGYFPELMSHMVKTVVTTPLTIEGKTNNTQGSLTGWSFANDPFPAEYRFLKVSKSVLTPVDTIKQAGQWAFNPAGVPVAILTGKLAADAVEKDLKKNKKRGED
ncbi:phytoene desaturase family protein [Youngiibacter fragilis]|uniref:Amine oxidase n=1 Tax=Youngiibacter fragilis 232.1 TaxID=994573 RepID=V7I7I0_9CLOT|nr:NAD(P)/FAD-dependent oxidoreductase [Youngiibacter fragilis]ETA81189.1 amine oxidase [Youngiibacter fragilis 232.1]